MGFLSFLFGSKKQADNTDYIDQSMKLDSKKAINNHPITEINPESIYPWADKIVFNNEITIGNIIMLWWLNKYWNKDRNIPLYFERNYVKDYKVERQKLVKHGYIEQSGKLTDLGQNALSENHKYVELHRNNWITPEESAKNSELQYQQMENTARFDEAIGMTEHAKELRKEIASEKAITKIDVPYSTAESLGKNGKPQESLNILIPLLPKAKGPSRYMRAQITKRIAIDSRKLKKYDQEIAFLNKYIKEELDQYGYDRYKDDFLKRINKATQLMSK